MNELVHIIPIAVVGAMGLLVTIERTVALFLTYPLPSSDAFFERVRELVLNDRLRDAIHLCYQRRSRPAGYVMWQGLLRAHLAEPVIQNGLGVAVSQMSRKVQKRTGFLATVANVATLLGLFGTILGLVQSFQAIGGAGAQQRAALLTRGISTAMNATLLGLGVAIPCLLIYYFLSSRTNRHLAEIEEAALRSLELINEHYCAGPNEADGERNSRGEAA